MTNAKKDSGLIPLELLAPAKDLECGKAAINYGADAVYIGAPKFGARSAAGNSFEDIEQLIQYAHRYFAKVYITLNTVLYDHELEEAGKLVQRVHAMGADALIIQDMGLLELGLPPIPLFASTQTHNYDPGKILFLEKAGFRRIILARELGLRQIKSIREKTSIDLEFFVHGALCVSFSGQCYISQAEAGRSANRGECAQLCRLPYSLVDGNGRSLAEEQHLLSLKDMNLSEFLPQLIDAGISSFKIEGRLKDAAYVKNITSFYRAKLDAAIEGKPGYRKASSGSTIVSFAPDPERSFSRGFTTYFLRGRREEIASLQTPKALGKEVGTVSRIIGNDVICHLKEPLHNGDGICFFDDHNELCGVNINTVEGNRVSPNSISGLAPGTILYRNHDHAFDRLLKSDQAKRRIPVSMIFEETEEGYCLRATDEDGVTAEASIAAVKEAAKKPEAAAETIRTQISKLGETIFDIADVEIRVREARFLPVSVLNQLRRDVIQILEQERVRLSVPPPCRIDPTDHPFPEIALDYSANVTNEKARAFYTRHGVQKISKGYELTPDNEAALMTTRHCLQFQFGLCKGDKGQDVDLYLSNGRTKYKLEFDCDRCVMKILG